MDNPGCEWVRGRLPLWRGDGGDRDDDGSDLGAEDRRAIEDHLRGCARCRAHQAGLARALEALAVTAGPSWVVPDATSLWPSLERRIAAHHRGDDPRRPRARESVAAGGPACTALDDERPLRSAWMRDTLREVVEAAGLGALSDRSDGGRPGRAGRSPGVARGAWRVAGVSLAASVLALLVALPVAWRRQAVAEATIVANTAPAASLVGPPAPAESAMAEVEDPAPEEDRRIPADQLAQAEPIRPPAEPPSAADAKAGPRSEAPVRFGHDLDLGTPMPPDGRDAKPVY